MSPDVTGTRTPLPIAPRLPRLLVGLALCGTAVAMMVEADLGLGPWDVLHQGLAVRTGLSIGQAVILVGALVLGAWYPLRERPGLGTVLNILVIGTVVDLGRLVLPEVDGIALRTAMLVVSLPLFAVGSGLYIGAGLGSGPRDGVMTGLARRGWPVGIARAAIEFSVLAVGWVLGGTVGVGTLVFATAVGPLVHVALPRLRAPGVAA
jgi:uncharacterized membrane protein YczE